MDHGKQNGSENDKEEKSGNANMLACIAMLTNGKSYPLQNPKMEEGKTSPKKHFTEDSLLSAMERAGAEEMPDEAERKESAHQPQEQRPLRSWCGLALWKEKEIRRRNIFYRLIKEWHLSRLCRNRSSHLP